MSGYVDEIKNFRSHLERDDEFVSYFSLSYSRLIWNLYEVSLIIVRRVIWTKIFCSLKSGKFQIFIHRFNRQIKNVWFSPGITNGIKREEYAAFCQFATLIWNKFQITTENRTTNFSVYWTSNWNLFPFVEWSVVGTSWKMLLTRPKRRNVEKFSWICLF